MKDSHEFYLSAVKLKIGITISIAMMYVGTIILISSICLITLPILSYEFDGAWWAFPVFAVGFAISALGGINYDNFVNQKWKLVINKTGISEIGHPNSNDDWHVSWEEIKKIIYPSNQPGYKQQITIILQHPRNSKQRYQYLDNKKFYISKSGLLPADVIYIYNYDDFDNICMRLRYFIEKQEQEHAEELAKQERIYKEHLAQKERQERDYFQRIKKLDDIQKIDPIQFEKLIFSLFKKMGYDVLLTKASRDEGIDLIISKNGKKSVVQCKRYSGTVGQPVVRDLYGSMIHNRAENAYLITTGVFSLPTQTWVSGKPIQLVDGKMLVEWIETILGKDGIG